MCHEAEKTSLTSDLPASGQPEWCIVFSMEEKKIIIAYFILGIWEQIVVCKRDSLGLYFCDRGLRKKGVKIKISSMTEESLLILSNGRDFT